MRWFATWHRFAGLNRKEKKMNLIDGVAYVAHPYGGLGRNKEEVTKIIKKIHEKYPCLILLSPLSIFEYEEYSSRPDEYTTHMVDCLTLLDRCDHLILTGDWENSRGCLCEWGFAQSKKGMRIYTWYGGDLHEM